ncbi:hypothetical protein SAMD00019534_056090 [Acytostelium subglobosum LB1]|uniref:hypothetical protein n=1 Tax=Acytostelium subglobosum LB1 TaxID=1410327 RepID=UPI000644FCEA|nr:hypothetical protein SAMD00019534_056090 [Acytostelium subglobosum LB1]GAM22434.1 hypothetical protein SAMD00019534_056090 [Acytostelium subglobosum LB1]|eukprot:XP_012754554.1 hypothetical protein SAMD00019534_056090 [Acytostelium subglobosum LB1]
MVAISQDIDLQFLSKYFHLPINDVAKEIGVCATVLKKICRKNGIPRWPHRKIKSIDKMISNLENSSPKNADEEHRIKEEISTLKKKKAYLIKHPNILAIKSSIKQKEVEQLNQRISENQFELSQVTAPQASLLSQRFGLLAAAAASVVTPSSHSSHSSSPFSETKYPNILVSNTLPQHLSHNYNNNNNNHYHNHSNNTSPYSSSPLHRSKSTYLSSAPLSPPSPPSQVVSSASSSSTPSSLSRQSSHQDITSLHLLANTGADTLQTLRHAANSLEMKKSYSTPHITTTAPAQGQPEMFKLTNLELPKLANIPSIESQLNTFKTLEPTLFKRSSSVVGSPQLESSNNNNNMVMEGGNSATSSRFSPLSLPSIAPPQQHRLPPWFKEDVVDHHHASGATATSASVLRLPINNVVVSKKATIPSITRVDQLISSEDDNSAVPSHLSPSSPISFD